MPLSPGHKKGSGNWGIVALDSETGEDAFFFPYYSESNTDGFRNFFSNPYFAGLEAVGQEGLAAGSIGGLVYITPKQQATSDAARCVHLCPPALHRTLSISHSSGS